MTLILVAEKGINKLWCNVVAVPDTVDVLPVHQETVQSSGTPPPATTVHSCSTVHTTNPLSASPLQQEARPSESATPGTVSAAG